MLPDSVLRATLAQVLEGAVTDPVVPASKNAMQARVSTMRRCFEEAIADVLEARNARYPPLPNDVLPLVFVHLPFDDLLTASRTCRRWRSVALLHSRLWSRLGLNAYDADEDKTRGYDGTVHNIPMLRKLLPRAKTHPLELDIEITADEPAVAFSNDLTGFLSTVAPRLIGLHVVCAAPWFIAQVLEDRCRAFPELREFTISPSVWRSRTYSLVSFKDNVMPSLVHLALHSDWRLSTHTCWPDLRILECAGDDLSGIKSILYGCRLQRLHFEWTYERFEAINSTLPDAEHLAALYAIPNVQVTAELCPVFEQLLFDVFAPSPSPQLHLCFTKPFHRTGPLQLRPCARLSSAVHLSVSRGDKSVVILADNGSGRRTQISLREIRRATVDWALIPSLDALTSLKIEASLWPELMQNFPACPKRVDLTLKVGHAVALDAFLAPAAPVPRAQTLSLCSYSEWNTTVSAEQVQALKTAVGADHVLLEGVTITNG